MCYDSSTVDVLISAYESGDALSQFMSHMQIEELCHSSSADVRAWTAKALANDSNENYAVDLLCCLAQDRDPIVRVEAIDSLCNFSTPKSYDTLCSAIKDPDPLVRAYASFGIALVGSTISPESARKTLLQRELVETADRVLVGIYEGLYILGVFNKVNYLIALCQSSNYHVCCAALHALEEIVDKNNLHMILPLIENLSVSVHPAAVADAILQLRLKCNTLISIQ